MFNLMIIDDVVNIFSMKTYKSSRKLRVGLNWSTTATALLPIIASYQVSPPENKTFIFQLVWLYVLKVFCCVFVPFTLEIVLPYLLDLGCYFGEVISI